MLLILSGGWEPKSTDKIGNFKKSEKMRKKKLKSGIIKVETVTTLHLFGHLCIINLIK